MDDSDGSVFINVRHGNPNWGNLYQSESFNSDFVLSMDYNRREPSVFYVDFREIFGLDGIYVANQFQGIQDPSNPNDLGIGAQSRITYDGGAQWIPLSIPLDSLSGTPLSCSSDALSCQLNLHGYFRLDIYNSLSFFFYIYIEYGNQL
jgi:hypothetical protein